MSAASRARPLPLLRSSLLARSSGGGGCRSSSSSSYSSAAAARALPARAARCRPSSSPPSRGVVATAGRTWRYARVRWNSTEGSSSSSVGSDDSGSIASSQTSLGSEAGVDGEAQRAPAGAIAFAFE